MNASQESPLPVWRHRWLARSPVLGFALVAYVFTWGLTLPLLAARRGWIDGSPGEGWEAVAAFGPLVAALAVSWSLAGAHGVAEILRGMTRWRAGARWMAFSVLSPFALLAAAALILRVGTGAWPDFAALADGRLGTAAGVLHLVVISGLVQGIGEEPGWRGFMLPRLRMRFSPLAATLVLFPVWLFWHLPAFLGRPFGVGQGIAFALGVLSAAIWLTFIREHTAGTLMAIAWHALINVARGIALAISMPMFLAMSTLVLAGAVAIVVHWLLTRRKHAI
jgi:membrane protease YdiL (CAAX protease family)